MGDTVTASRATVVETNEQPEFDALIIGAGISGMYQLIRLRELGLKVRIIEAGTGVGGTWYWNRYPGARFDSESYSYGYSFSKELLAEWNWTEHFSPQPVTLEYLNLVADKFDLRRDIDFKSRVTAARYSDATRSWTVTVEGGRSYRGRFLITAIGPLSAPIIPQIPGMDTFKGEVYHTATWPHHPVSFAGKRVGIIGTGASGVQAIAEIAKTAGHLTVFQRTPNWCKPLQNRPITPAEMEEIRGRYAEIFKRCEESYACFLHSIDPRGTFEVSAEDREAFLEQQYRSPGFGMWQGNFRDMLTDREANKLVSDFVARKIRQRVKDPRVAEMLIPKDHGFGTRRVPMETNYYETYNQPNVQLISIKETPIARITEASVVTTEREVPLDMLIYATGFDAVVGSFSRIDIRGLGGQSLKEAWDQSIETHLGVQVLGFPNMMMLVGPHTALGNIPRSIEYNVEWVTGLVAHMQKHGMTRVDAKPEAVRVWTDYVHEMGKGLLTNEVDSWMTGVNRNIAGREQRIIFRYSGSAPAYRAWCDKVAAGGYREIDFA